jgi:hypothetical protein
VSAITSDEKSDVGVSDEPLLNEFVEAAVYRDEPRLAEAREAFELKLGTDALVDAAAVIGCFQRLNRMADGAGIELDEQMVMMTGGIRDELNIDDYASAANTPRLTGMKRLLSVVMRPFEGFMMRAMQKGIQKAQVRQHGARKN